MTDGFRDSSPDLGSVGRCIYCGATGDLTDEHPIPFSLGGPAILYQASCRECAKITSQVERTVSRDHFLLFRVKLELPTRRPAERPTHIYARVRRGELWTEEDVPIEMVAGVAGFPVLPVPAVLDRRGQSDTITILDWRWVLVDRKDRPAKEVAAAAGIDEVQFSSTVNARAFMRLLAKVAWCFSVARYGLENLRPGVLGAILGTDRDLNTWIGFPPPDANAFAEDDLNVFLIHVESVGSVLTARIRLFGAQGGPEYLVVVGQLLHDRNV